MAVRLYQSTDPEAPVLDGLPGSLTNVLRKCLVDGYGSVGAGTRKDPLGWTAMFDGTGFKGAFRSTDPSASGCWLYVDDSGPHPTQTSQAADWRGYETFSGFDGGGNPVGDGPFPRTDQQSHWWCYKSNTANGTAKPWTLIGDEKSFVFLPSPYVGGEIERACYYVGDLNGLLASDDYAFAVYGSAFNGFSTNVSAHTYFNRLYGSAAAPVGIHCYLARAFDGVLKSRIAYHGFFGIVSSYFDMQGITSGYPHLLDGGLLMSDFFVFESSSGGNADIVRGKLRGVYWARATPSLIEDGTEFTNIAGLEGRTLRAVRIHNGILLFDMTGPWD